MKGRAGAFLGMSEDFAVVVFNDLFAKCQSNTCTLKFTAAMETLEYSKDLGGKILVEANTIVADDDLTVCPSGVELVVGQYFFPRKDP